MARKDAIVSKMTEGIEYLFRKNKITWLKGHGRFAGKGEGGWQIEVAGGGKPETVEGKTIVIATGSKARHLPACRSTTSSSATTSARWRSRPCPKRSA